MFDWTTYNNLACLQIDVDTILFSNRQFDSFFDTTHAVIGVTRAHAQLPHSSIT